MEEQIIENQIIENQIIENQIIENQMMSAKDRLAQIESERNTLRAQVSKEEAVRLAKAAENRKIRDAKIQEVAVVLVKVQKEIFIYNRSGVRLKGKNNILETIANLIVPGEIEENIVGTGAEPIFSN